MTNPSSVTSRGDIRSENFVGALADFARAVVVRGVVNVRSSIFITHDALPAPDASNRRRARTRLAKPKSVNNCAVFFVNPR